MQVETRTDLNSIASIERVGRQPGSFNRKQFYNAQPPLHVARGASEFSDQAAVLVGEERGGAFVKRRLEVCTGLLRGCTTKGVGQLRAQSRSSNISPLRYMVVMLVDSIMTPCTCHSILCLVSCRIGHPCTLDHALVTEARCTIHKNLHCKNSADSLVSTAGHDL
jgi:hypothetical protein